MRGRNKDHHVILRNPSHNCCSNHFPEYVANGSVNFFWSFRRHSGSFSSISSRVAVKRDDLPIFRSAVPSRIPSTKSNTLRPPVDVHFHSVNHFTGTSLHTKSIPPLQNVKKYLRIGVFGDPTRKYPAVRCENYACLLDLMHAIS